MMTGRFEEYLDREPPEPEPPAGSVAAQAIMDHAAATGREEPPF